MTMTRQEQLNSVVKILEKSLKEMSKVSFNQLRRSNPGISMTAESFFLAVQEDSYLLPPGFKVTPKKGKIDPSVVTDIEIEKSGA